MASQREPQRQMHSGPVLINLALNSGAQDRKIELMNFEMDLLNILETEAHDASQGGKGPSDKISGLCGRVCS